MAEPHTPPTIVLCGGGSGGHITPLLSVARQLKQLRPDVRLIYIGEKNGKFAHLVENEKMFEATYFISAGKFRRYPGSKLKKVLDVPTNARNVRDGVRVVKGTIEARKLLKRLRPDGIFIKGGHVGVPVGKAAAGLHIPYITHDSDTTPGLTNRLIAKSATIHATGMPVEFYRYPRDKTVFTGTPVAAEFSPLSPASKAAFRAELGIDENSEVIAITGGSQGAERLNDALVAIAPRLLDAHPQAVILHIAGKTHEEGMTHQYHRRLLEPLWPKVVVKGFVDDMYRYTGAADVVITRASATTLNELAAQRQAAIVVPALLADDHQTKNAVQLAKEDAVVLLEQEAINQDSSLLLKAIEALLADPVRRRELGRNLARLSKPNAASELADLLLKTFVKA